MSVKFAIFALLFLVSPSVFAAGYALSPQVGDIMAYPDDEDDGMIWSCDDGSSVRARMAAVYNSQGSSCALAYASVSDGAFGIVVDETDEVSCTNQFMPGSLKLYRLGGSPVSGYPTCM